MNDADLHCIDLWPRISAAYQTRRRRRLWLRRGAVGGALAAILATAVLMLPPRQDTATASAIDWRARAQALELQLDNLPLPTSSNSMAQLAESQLADIDQRLQAAYDDNANAADVAALWQRRSELLVALLSVRRTRIAPANI